MTTFATLAIAQSLGFTKHHFSYVPKEPSTSVSVAGTFNDWNKDAHPMKLESDGRTWSLDVDLKYGQTQYKFVRNGNEWIPDPKAEKNEDDGNGNINSFLTILPPEFANPAKRGDGKIDTSSLEHKSSLPYFNVDGQDCYITLRARKSDLDLVVVVVNGKSTAAKVTTSNDIYEFHQAVVKWDRKQDISYSFMAVDGHTGLTFGKGKYTVSAKSYKPFIVPAWVPRSVIYQIFPDRFENGDSANDPKNLTPWDGVPTYSNRFGGDAAGVTKRISYLKDLGISTVYYTPVFQSPSNHRYEADSYLTVDPEFGTNTEFAKLTKDLRFNGISTVMDFAFNHTSVRTAQFADLVKKGSASEFKDWYFPKSYPVIPGDSKTYEAWYGYPSMPKLNTINPATTAHLLKVCDYWLKDVGVQGMRLDVGNEVDQNFWRAMRPHVKSLNPNAWILGEVWGDGNPWLQGDQWDSVMNYQFREAALRFVAKGTQDGTQFASALTRVNKSYPSQVSRNMMNLLSSHDTPRFLTECGGDKDLAKLGAALQFTWIGEPSIYYGEELGMEGGKDPENRRGMEWAKATQDNDMLSFYKKLIRTRQRTDAFATGKAEFIISDKDGGVFTREGQRDAAVVFFNRSTQPKQFQVRVPPPIAKLANSGLFDAFTGTSYLAPDRPITVTVKPKSFSILVTPFSSNSSLSNPAGVKTSASGRGSVQRRANLTNRSQLIK